jgi:hypothetical protein
LPAAELTLDQKAALDMSNSPNHTNPFVTRNELPPTELTLEESAALHGARNPNAMNPLATLDDIPSIRIIAAGYLDLSRPSPSNIVGRLGVVVCDLERGLATLSFPNFDVKQWDTYIVNALPINQNAIHINEERKEQEEEDKYERKRGGMVDQMQREVIVVQFVEFVANGFTLHMATLPHRLPSLGPCMVEVLKIR